MSIILTVILGVLTTGTKRTVVIAIMAIFPVYLFVCLIKLSSFSYTQDSVLITLHRLQPFIKVGLVSLI